MAAGHSNLFLGGGCLITMEYTQKKIFVVPDGEDFPLVEKVFKGVDWATYNCGVWEIRRAFFDELSTLLAPFKDRLVLSKAFKAFAEEFRETNTERYTGGKKGTVLIYANVNNSVIQSRHYPYEALDTAMKYFFKPAKRSKKFQEGLWDGYIHLLDLRNKKVFPTGLLFIAKEVLEKEGYSYKIVYKYDRAPARQFNWYVDDGITLDPDQIEAVRLAYEAKRSVCKAPTGFGKTAILAKQLTAKFGVRTLFVANKKSLLDDARDEFVKGIVGLEFNDVGEIKDGIFGHTRIDGQTRTDQIPDLDMPVIVATIQSLDAKLKDPRTSHKLKEWLSGVKFIMVDETQAVNDKTWADVLENVYAPYRVFLSATPRRTDGATLLIHAGSGDISFWTTAETQIEKGRLSEVEIIYRVFDHKLYNEKDDSIEYIAAYNEWIVLNAERNQNIINYAKELVDEGRHVLVLIQFIEHGELLFEMMKESGFAEQDIRFIYGETPDKVRRRAISEFKKGDFKVLIGSTIFDAGVNIPIISGIVMAGAGNSDITLIQRIGRSVRNADYQDILGYLPEFMLKNDGKKKAKVIDIFDGNVKFFERQAYNRMRNAKDEFGASRVTREGRIEKPTVVKESVKKSSDKDIAHKLHLLYGDLKTPDLPDKEKANIDDPEEKLFGKSIADVMRELREHNQNRK